MTKKVQENKENIKNVEQREALLNKHNLCECQCKQSEIYSERYGTYVPCMHMIMNGKSVKPSKFPEGLFKKALTHQMKVEKCKNDWNFPEKFSNTSQKLILETHDLFKQYKLPSLSDEPNKYFFMNRLNLTCLSF